MCIIVSALLVQDGRSYPSISKTTTRSRTISIATYSAKSSMKKNATKIIAVNAVVAAMYVVLTMPFGVITTGIFQFRPAEALAILPAIAPYTMIGLAIGCGISNMVSLFGIYDIVLGSLVTLLAGYLSSTKLLCNKWLAPLPPILLNALLLPLIWLLSDSSVGYLICMCSLLVSQSVVIYGLGVPLYMLTKKRLMPMISLDS